MNYEEEIIRYISINRVSTTEVADALGKEGVLFGIMPLADDAHCVGRARAVFTANNSNYSVHEQIREIKEGEIVVLFTHNCENRGVIGDLIAKFILLYQGATALVVDGLVRDGSRLKREGYNIWTRGVSPLGCFNTPAEPFPHEEEKKLRQQVDGGIAVCDGGGVTVIPQGRANAETLERLQQIELQEDIWYYCLDTLKWDTKRIVCDREYLSNQEQIGRAHV